ncbi:MAG: hypothetical protein KME17_08165 [Cyanosarcina radialis HA8281-LM2]|jgi:hypothetical protein|nr:hypothetical protein [Cyanosarcina radialis HA8281-LM2]
MAKMLVQQLTEYFDDLGNKHKNVRFKMRDGFETFAGALYSLPVNKKCSVSKIYEMRYLHATFEAENTDGGGVGIDGARIKFPVPSPDADVIKEMVLQLRTKGAVCIDYVGERWSKIPYVLFNGTAPDRTSHLLINKGVFADKKAGRATIISDVLGRNQLVNVAYEINPAELSDKFVGCIGDLEEDRACITSTIKCRYATVRGRAKASESEGTPVVPLIRKVPIKTRDDIGSCLQTLSGVKGVECLDYHGESVPRVDQIFFGVTDIDQPALPPVGGAAGGAGAGG